MFTMNPVQTTRPVAWVPMRDRLRVTTYVCCGESVLAVLAMPASAGTTQVSGIPCSTTSVNRRSGVHPLMEGMTLQSISPGVCTAAGR